MQIVIEPLEIQKAPHAVQKWFNEHIFGSASADEPPKKKTSGKPKPKTKEVPDRKDVLEKAAALIEAKGEEVLGKILNKLEISRVRECPEDKLADLLAEIAIHA